MKLRVMVILRVWINITHAKWESIKNMSLLWKELDRFQDVHENVEWEKGPKGLFMHSSCYTLTYLLSVASFRRRYRASARCEPRPLIADILSPATAVVANFQTKSSATIWDGCNESVNTMSHVLILQIDCV